MLDTHCHLNFKAFAGQVEKIINDAKKAGVRKIVVPGTDVRTSKKAVQIAEKHQGIYAAVGIHPHHIYQYQAQNSNLKTQNYSLKLKNNIKEVEKLLENKKVVAIGEVGLDRHYYQKTKYQNYKIDEDFLNLQKEVFINQIKLAIKYKKSLIIHNREAAGEMLTIIGDSPILNPLAGRMVFHCCEANDQLLEFALAHRIYIGVDGDVTYNKEKQQFVKKIPLDLLLLETDSPFLLPEPLRSQKKFPNQPKNLLLIAEFVARLKKLSGNQLIKTTTENSQKFFNLFNKEG